MTLDSSPRPEPSPLDPVCALINEALDDRKSKGLFRTDPPPWADLQADFSTNDYLAMSSHRGVIDAGREAAIRLGAGSRSARLLGLSHDLSQELEEVVRPQIPVGWSASYVQSGFAANLAFFDAVFKILAHRGNTVDVVIDHEAHASLFAGVRQKGLSWKVFPFRHGNWDHLALRLEQSVAHIRIIVVESLHSMNGTFADARRLGALCRRFPNTFLYVDEAHSMGLVGGLYWSFCSEIWRHLEGFVLGAMGGCGKAVGVSGGLLVTPQPLREALFQFSRPLIYSTSPTPFVLGAVKRSLQILSGPEGEDRRQILQAKVGQALAAAQDLEGVMGEWELRSGMCSVMETRAPLLCLRHRVEPWFANGLAAYFLRGGVRVPFIRPPTVPRGGEKLRISLSVRHDVSKLLATFAQFLLANNKTFNGSKVT